MGAEPLPCSILKTRGSVHKSTLRPVAKRNAAATRLAETRQHDALRPTNPSFGWNARPRAQRLRGVADSIETSASLCLPVAAGFSGQLDLVNGAPIADDTNGPTWHGPMVLAAKATRCRHGWYRKRPEARFHLAWDEWISFYVSSHAKCGRQSDLLANFFDEYPAWRLRRSRVGSPETLL